MRRASLELRWGLARLNGRVTGALGESVALRYLVGEGYALVQRNYRTRYGEIDLILRRGDVLVFVEVKARRGRGFGDPLEAVTPRKRKRVRLMAEAYLAERGTEFAEGFEEMRFDAVGVLVGGGTYEVRHVEDAF